MGGGAWVFVLNVVGGECEPEGHVRVVWAEFLRPKFEVGGVDDHSAGGASKGQSQVVWLPLACAPPAPACSPAASPHMQAHNPHL